MDGTAPRGRQAHHYRGGTTGKTTGGRSARAADDLFDRPPTLLRPPTPRYSCPHSVQRNGLRDPRLVEHDGRLYLAMELFPGGSLSDHRGTLPWPELR